MVAKKPVTFREDPILATITPAQEFVQDSVRLINRCQKPNAKEFKQIAIATGVGFLIMGFVGFFVKLIHIPINNIIIGQ
jgi:protein transport protein SEC61 subunit gamma and related proteins